jgi:hypothetical protein
MSIALSSEVECIRTRGVFCFMDILFCIFFDNFSVGMVEVVI